MIEMATVAPTNDMIDAWAAESWLLGQISGDAIQSIGQPQTYWIFAYTQNDGTPVYDAQGDPTGSQYFCLVAQGLLAEYGSLNIREYTWTFTPAVLDVATTLADDTEQARVTDQANWFPAA
jgi:hypothetical protein